MRFLAIYPVKQDILQMIIGILIAKNLKGAS